MLRALNQCCSEQKIEDYGITWSPSLNDDSLRWHVCAVCGRCVIVIGLLHEHGRTQEDHTMDRPLTRRDLYVDSRTPLLYLLRNVAVDELA